MGKNTGKFCRNRKLKMIFIPKMEKVTTGQRILHNEVLRAILVK
jgi:hypothetical protein